MNVTKIPFIQKVGIIKNKNDELELGFDEKNHNHLKTIHASAQFTLAETASGEMLQEKFPELTGKVVPLLRDSQIKFKKTATKTIFAIPNITSEAVEKFNNQFTKKGRASIVACAIIIVYSFTYV